SAKYLGVIIDRRLRWHEEIEHVVAKGSAATLAIARLARPTFGLPHKYARQLYISVVLPRMTYGCVVWYEPVRQVAGRKRAKGSVGTAARLERVQRIAALFITGAFRTTATDALLYHAALLPAHL
ncbi:hypothetical protein K525DRAFT_154517, partial [Schizophyllum commune Loenen D]